MIVASNIQHRSAQRSAIKKALIFSAFFIACYLPGLSLGQSCSGFSSQENARIAHIHDGDTVHLSDQRKIRLIGIDTPELARRRGQQQLAEQPFAVVARDYARQLIEQHGSKVALMPGIEARDRYGRHLFHIQLSDGSLLQNRLLEAGLAVAFTTPPNQQLSNCYRQSEKLARAKKRGIWSHTKYQPIDRRKLTSQHKGFHLVRGTVTHIGESKKAFWINFGHHFAARIQKTDLAFFTTPLHSLVGRQVLIKGWLRQFKNKHQVSLRHPSAIEILGTENVDSEITGAIDQTN